MTSSPANKDLVVLVADKNIEYTVKGLLSRQQSLGVRELSTDIYVHPESDPGCFLRAQDFLRPFHGQYAHTLVMLDRDGCGRENLSRESLEEDLEGRLSKAGWQDRAAAIVLDPELEIWVWSDSPEVDSALGWATKRPGLREWLCSEGYLAGGETKPNRPKEAVVRALRISRKSRSSSLYLQLAECVSTQRCSDPAFVKFKTMLQRWFRRTGP